MSKLSLKDARCLLKLLQDNRIPFSSMSAKLAEELCDEGIVSVVSNGSRKRLCLIHKDYLKTYVTQRFGIRTELEQWIEIMSLEADRATQVEYASDSKLKATRTFRGFLVKTLSPINALLRGKPFTIFSPCGTAVFIEDFSNLVISKDVLIVGIENGENFMRAEQSLYLFPQKNILFVSRYPQSSDLRTWLQSIENQYIHFGDFDLAGINIYLTEFYSYLGDRASFFIPENIEELLSKGNSDLYDKQYQRYKDMNIRDLRVKGLVDTIHKYRKAYEQEGLLVKV